MQQLMQNGFLNEAAKYNSNTVYRLNGILTNHYELLKSYQFLTDAIESKPLQELFNHLRMAHQQEIERVTELICAHDGQPQDRSCTGTVMQKMRDFISTRMTYAIDIVEEMLKLERDFVEAHLDGFVPLVATLALIEQLKQTSKAANVRINHLARFVENNGNL